MGECLGEGGMWMGMFVRGLDFEWMFGGVGDTVGLRYIEDSHIHGWDC